MLIAFIETHPRLKLWRILLRTESINLTEGNLTERIEKKMKILKILIFPLLFRKCH